MSSSNDYELPRGKAQVLRGYAPGNVVNFGQLGVTTKITGWDFGGRYDDIDKERVANLIKSRASRYRNRTVGDKWENISADSIDIIELDGAESELFPLVFYCEDPNCRKVHTADSPEYLPDDGTCYACGTDLTQLTFVNIHPCGNIEGPDPDKPCPDHAFDDYRIVKNQTAPATWYYQCRKCGKRMGRLGTNCEACDEEMIGPIPASSSRVHYTQTGVIIDIPFIDEDPDDIPHGEPWTRTLMSIHLDSSKLKDHTIESLAATSGNAEKYNELVESYGKEVAQDMIETMEISIEGRDKAVSETQHITPPDLGNIEEGDTSQQVDPVYANISRELFTYLRSTRGYQGDNDDLDKTTRHPVPNSLDDYLQRADFIDRHPQSRRYKSQLAETNIRNAWVVDQFPLLNLSYGRTRGSPRPQDTDLRELNHPLGRNLTPVFADRTPSEAIIFEVDRAAIVNWLAANGIIDGVPDTDDEKALKSWFLNNIATTKLENPFTAIDHEVTKAVYTLLHTMSHTLLSTAGEQCGLATGSLSERLLPTVPAIIIYAASTENFALGSMFTLFKTRIFPWLGHARDLADQCLLDPACSDGPDGAACDACVFTNITSCESLNEHLDRQLLTGGSGVTGFWSSEIENGIEVEDPDLPLS